MLNTTVQLTRVDEPLLKGQECAYGDYRYRVWDCRWIDFDAFPDRLRRPALVTINNRSVAYVRGSGINGTELRMSEIHGNATVYRWEPVVFPTQLECEETAFNAIALGYMVYERTLDEWMPYLRDALAKRGMYVQRYGKSIQKERY